MRRRMLHPALLVWALALTTASAQDEVVLSGQITDPHGNPVAPGAVTVFDLFLSSRGTEGRFSMRVIPGVYTATARPPAAAGSPLLERTERDVRVDAGSQLNVILETGERFVLSGQFRKA